MKEAVGGARNPLLTATRSHTIHQLANGISGIIAHHRNMAAWLCSKEATLTTLAMCIRQTVRQEVLQTLNRGATNATWTHALGAEVQGSTNSIVDHPRTTTIPMEVRAKGGWEAISYKIYPPRLVLLLWNLTLLQRSTMDLSMISWMVAWTLMIFKRKWRRQLPLVWQGHLPTQTLNMMKLFLNPQEKALGNHQHVGHLLLRNNVNNSNKISNHHHIHRLEHAMHPTLCSPFSTLTLQTKTTTLEYPTRACIMDCRLAHTINRAPICSDRLPMVAQWLVKVLEATLYPIHTIMRNPTKPAHLQVTTLVMGHIILVRHSMAILHTLITMGSHIPLPSMGVHGHHPQITPAVLLEATQWINPLGSHSSSPNNTLEIDRQVLPPSQQA
mmetsp:Transcript_62215/g.92281  ORF Transcript_62215/g.92281 Transcript_62215/m.92281 type:complete len:385 (+) Transcript_62215:341-1495(+)